MGRSTPLPYLYPVACAAALVQLVVELLELVGAVFSSCCVPAVVLVSLSDVVFAVVVASVGAVDSFVVSVAAFLELVAAVVVPVVDSALFVGVETPRTYTWSTSDYTPPEY